MKYLLLIILILFLITSNAQHQRKLELEKQISSIIQKYPIAGIGVAVLSADSIFFAKGFGYSDLEKKKPYTLSTIQNIASISKTTIGVSIVKAEELGLLKITDPINRHLPFKIYNPNFPDKVITIQHLATHTSSLKDRSLLYHLKCYQKEQDLDISLKDFVKMYFHKDGKWYSKKNFSKHEPGKAYEYSNIAATLAAYIIEYKSGISYADFTKKHIFEPLKMANSGWYFKDIDKSRHSNLYNESLKPKKLYSLVTYPDGGLRTCIKDLSAYFQMLLNKGEFNGVKIIGQSSADKMMKPQFNPESLPLNFHQINQGIFWEIEKSRLVDQMEGHSGGDPGVITMMFYIPKYKIGIITFGNTDPGKKNIEGYNAIWNLLLEFASNI